MNENNKARAAQAVPNHSCYEWNRQHYISTPEYTAACCGTCGKITSFRWRKVWKRLFNLFFHEVVKFPSEVPFAIRNWWKWR